MRIINKKVHDHFRDLNPNLEKLHSEVKSEPGITAKIKGINKTGDNIDIIFDRDLTPDEHIALDNLVTSHINTDPKKKQIFYNITPKKSDITTKNSYTQVSIFKYGGSNIIGPINYIEIISNKDPDVTSYDVRVINIKTGDIIAEKTEMTNNSLEIHDLGTISNIPTTAGIFELQAKKIGESRKSSIHIESIIVYHNN